jgi:hypothetical protein
MSKYDEIHSDKTEKISRVCWKWIVYVKLYKVYTKTRQLWVDMSEIMRKYDGFFENRCREKCIYPMLQFDPWCPIWVHLQPSSHEDPPKVFLNVLRLEPDSKKTHFSWQSQAQVSCQAPRCSPQPIPLHPQPTPVPSPQYKPVMCYSWGVLKYNSLHPDRIAHILKAFFRGPYLETVYDIWSNLK